MVLPSLKLTAKAPENGWLEDDPFLLGLGLFSGAKMLASGRVMIGTKWAQKKSYTYVEAQ